MKTTGSLTSCGQFSDVKRGESTASSMTAKPSTRSPLLPNRSYDSSYFCVKVASIGCGLP